MLKFINRPFLFKEGVSSQSRCSVRRIYEGSVHYSPAEDWTAIKFSTQNKNMYVYQKKLLKWRILT